MPDTLPLPVAHYFAGKNARDFATAMSGFAASAIVKDEGHDHVGHAAIRTWMEQTTAQYGDQAKVTCFVSKDDSDVEVEASVSGNFPGSPAVLRFRFTLEHNLISRLAIGS